MLLAPLFKNDRTRGYRQMGSQPKHRRCQPNARTMVPLIAAIVLALASQLASAQDETLWGGLKPGPHAVGFRTHYELDHTRQYDPEYSTNATKPPAHSPRPILVAVWYPGEKTPAEPISYRQYLEIPSNNEPIAQFGRRLMAHMRNVVCEETIGKKPNGLNADEEAAFERFLSLKTIAIKDAKPAEGRFPVVIYHPGIGGSYEDNSVLFEYLASHGYIVLSSAYPRADATTMNIDWDLARSVRDMEVLARHARTLPFADADHLAAMGHSYGAQAVLAWRAEPCSPVNAVISIDSTVENVGIDYPGFAKLKIYFDDKKLNITVPTLRFASLENQPKFPTLEPYLKFAPRYEATVSSLEHNDYLTHGAIRPKLLATNPPDATKAQAIRHSYDKVCEHILQFSNATLKQDSQGQNYLKSSLEKSDPALKLMFRQPMSPPPTPRQLVMLLRREGATKTGERLRNCQGEIELGSIIAGAADVLVDDEQSVDAAALLSVGGLIVPSSALIQISLARALGIQGDKKAAIKAYQKALDLLDRDTELTDYLRSVKKAQIKEHLEQLNQHTPTATDR